MNDLYKSFKPISADKNKVISSLLNITDHPNAAELVTCIDDMVRDHFMKFQKGRTTEYLTTNQLRNIYDKVKRLSTPTEMQLLRPRLAYAAARQNSKEAQNIVEFLSEVIAKVSNHQEVENFKVFLEAVVGYHKYHATKKN
ncbi:MAG: type III-A CRISPR-associated protein Csm2 [Bacteroidota bacterium]